MNKKVQEFFDVMTEADLECRVAFLKTKIALKAFTNGNMRVSIVREELKNASSRRNQILNDYNEQRLFCINYGEFLTLLPFNIDFFISPQIQNDDRKSLDKIYIQELLKNIDDGVDGEFIIRNFDGITKIPLGKVKFESLNQNDIVDFFQVYEQKLCIKKDCCDYINILFDANEIFSLAKKSYMGGRGSEIRINGDFLKHKLVFDTICRCLDYDVARAIYRYNSLVKGKCQEKVAENDTEQEL